MFDQQSIDKRGDVIQYLLVFTSDPFYPYNICDLYLCISLFFLSYKRKLFTSLFQYLSNLTI